MLRSLATARPRAGTASVGAVKNGTATLSYYDELARIPIYAQAPISRRNEILLQNEIDTGHFRQESPTPAARFLFLGSSNTQRGSGGEHGSSRT
jgi:hypothetical protein